MSKKNKIYLGDIQLAATDDVVEGPASSTNNHVAVFDGTDGKKIKDGTYTIGSSVPSGAVFTDTKNTAGSTDDSSNLLYLIGAKTQGANPQTYSKSGLYIDGDGILTTPSLINMGGYAVGTVSGPASSVVDRVATFNDRFGKRIKDSGYTIATSVPSGAVFTDTHRPIKANGTQILGNNTTAVNFVGQGDISIQGNSSTGNITISHSDAYHRLSGEWDTSGIPPLEDFVDETIYEIWLLDGENYRILRRSYVKGEDQEMGLSFDCMDLDGSNRFCYYRLDFDDGGSPIRWRCRREGVTVFDYENGGD